MNDYFYSLEFACELAWLTAVRADRFSHANDIAVALYWLEDENNQ